MVEGMAHFLTGWVEFRLRGSGVRFLNAAAKSGVEFWGFRREGEDLILRGRPGEYRRLRGLFRRCGVHPRLLKKRGLPFLTARLWRRKGLAAGAALGAALYLFLSGFCWGVTVTGAETLTQAHVLQAARECGVYVGAPLRGFKPKAAGLSLRNKLPQATWLSVNTQGCFVEISLRESLPAPQVNDEGEWSNMVAARAGQVVSVEAERGRPVVSPGDVVEPGQLLIAGLYQQEVDPYSPPPEEPYQVLGAARGSVHAVTWREFTVEVPQLRQELEAAGEERRFALTLFGLRIPLGFQIPPGEQDLVWTQSVPWAPLGRELPVALERVTVQRRQERAVLLSEEAWKEEALLQLRRLQREELPPGSQVLEEELTYRFEEGVCTLSAQCRCEEEIGLVRKISVE